MKKLHIMLAIIALASIGAIGSPDAYAAGSSSHVATYVDYGTVTYKFTLDGDSATSIGHDYLSDSAIYTPWVPVPVGIPFWIFTETRDADSSKAFAPDTIHIGLFTTPAYSLAKDSVGSVKKANKNVPMWDFSSLTWTKFTQQTYFSLQRSDTLATDSIGGVGSDPTAAAVGGRGNMQNLGYLRFGICLDEADSLTDSGVRFNCYIVFQDPSGGDFNYPKRVADLMYDDNSYGNLEPAKIEVPEWAYVPKEN